MLSGALEKLEICFVSLATPKILEIFLVQAGKYYPVAVMLANARTCSYDRETSSYFYYMPPKLAEYFDP